MDKSRIFLTSLWFLLQGIGIFVMANTANDPEFYNREDLFDKTTRKLKPIREVIEDYHAKEIPNIRDCGPDEAQNWYEPDPLDCSCYFACDGKYYQHRRCTPGLFYDMKMYSCNWADEVECNDRPKPWTIPEYLSPQYVHQHYNVYEYTNTKLDKNNNSGSVSDRWLADDWDDDSLEYEYFM